MLRSHFPALERTHNGEPVAYFDARGWQTLVQNTYIHFPVPGRELETTLKPPYTYGGGLAGSAPAPDPHRCPVPLPRCP